MWEVTRWSQWSFWKSVLVCKCVGIVSTQGLELLGKVLTNNVNSNFVGPCLELWEAAGCSSLSGQSCILSLLMRRPTLAPSLVPSGRCEHLSGQRLVEGVEPTGRLPWKLAVGPKLCSCFVILLPGHKRGSSDPLHAPSIQSLIKSLRKKITQLLESLKLLSRGEKTFLFIN